MCCTLRGGKGYKGPYQLEDDGEEIVIEKEDKVTNEVLKQDKVVEAKVKITPPTYPSRLRNKKKKKRMRTTRSWTFSKKS